jgi:hypothetical protein
VEKSSDFEKVKAAEGIAAADNNAFGLCTWLS